ncbi:MAG: hypothetical protein LBF38_12100, partial [Deltaproteobacteria bacterium]|nr:hypothetical protein [Deltaproteobacteria bacterium]
MFALKNIILSPDNRVKNPYVALIIEVSRNYLYDQEPDIVPLMDLETLGDTQDKTTVQSEAGDNTHEESPNKPTAFERLKNERFNPEKFDRFKSLTMSCVESFYGDSVLSMVLHLDEEKPHVHVILNEKWNCRKSNSELLYDGPRDLKSLTVALEDYLAEMEVGDSEPFSPVSEKSQQDVRSPFYVLSHISDKAFTNDVYKKIPVPKCFDNLEHFNERFGLGHDQEAFKRDYLRFLYEQMANFTQLLTEAGNKIAQLNSDDKKITETLDSDHGNPEFTATHPIYYPINLYNLKPMNYKIDRKTWAVKLPDERVIKGDGQIWEDLARKNHGVGLTELAADIMGIPPDQAYRVMGFMPKGSYGGSLSKVYSLRDYHDAPYPNLPQPNPANWIVLRPWLVKETSINSKILDNFVEKGQIYPDITGRIIFPCANNRGYLAWDPSEKKSHKNDLVQDRNPLALEGAIKDQAETKDLINPPALEGALKDQAETKDLILDIDRASIEHDLLERPIFSAVEDNPSETPNEAGFVWPKGKARLECSPWLREYFENNGAMFFKGHFVMEGPGQKVFFTDKPLDALVLKALFKIETVVASNTQYIDEDLGKILSHKYLYACGYTHLGKRLERSLGLLDETFTDLPVDKPFFKVISLKQHLSWSDALRQSSLVYNLKPLPDQGDLSQAYVDHILVDSIGEDSQTFLDTNNLSPYDPQKGYKYNSKRSPKSVARVAPNWTPVPSPTLSEEDFLKTPIIEISLPTNEIIDPLTASDLPTQPEASLLTAPEAAAETVSPGTSVLAPSDSPKVPAKRGRKPRVKTETNPQTIPEAAAETVSPAASVPEDGDSPKVPAKRGRKPRVKTETIPQTIPEAAVEAVSSGTPVLAPSDSPKPTGMVEINLLTAPEATAVIVSEGASVPEAGDSPKPTGMVEINLITTPEATAEAVSPAASVPEAGDSPKPT